MEYESFYFNSFIQNGPENFSTYCERMKKAKKNGLIWFRNSRHTVLTPFFFGENEKEEEKVESKPGEYFEEDVKNEVKAEEEEEEEKVEVEESPGDSEGEKIKEEEVAEISSDEEEEEEVEYLEPERLKKGLKESEEKEIYLCPVGSCTFSLESHHIDKQQQHFISFHSQLDFSQLRFLKL